MPVVENGIMFFHHDPSHRKLLDDGLLLVIDWKYAPMASPVCAVAGVGYALKAPESPVQMVPCASVSPHAGGIC
jgi:hypothetical protein